MNFSQKMSLLKIFKFSQHDQLKTNSTRVIYEQVTRIKLDFYELIDTFKHKIQIQK